MICGGFDDGITGRSLLGAARGFSLFIWGILSSLVLLGGVVRVDWFERAAIPFHAVGCVLGVLGAHELTRRSLGPLRAERRLSMAALLNLYFVPLVVWWRQVPYAAHLVLNVYLAICAAAWFLIEICRQAGRTARVLGDGAIAREARWEWRLSLAFSGCSLAMFLGWTLVRFAAGDTSLYGAWDEAIRYLPGWIRALALMPFPAALICAWRAHGLCRRALAAAAQR